MDKYHSFICIGITLIFLLLDVTYHWEFGAKLVQLSTKQFAFVVGPVSSGGLVYRHSACQGTPECDNGGRFVDNTSTDRPIRIDICICGQLLYEAIYI